MSISLSKLKTYSIKHRRSKVLMKGLARPLAKRPSFKQFYHTLPQFLAANHLKRVVSAVIQAKRKKKPVIFFMGAHVIKCGLSPLVNRLIREGVITHVGSNGAALIHDFELAYAGKTSEDVDQAINDGSFGMAHETAEFVNAAAVAAQRSQQGLAYTVGERIVHARFPHQDISIFATCYKRHITASAHVAIGADIVHQHPSCNGAAIGDSTYRDFLILTNAVKQIGNGGVVLNFGSAVMMPEVFLKALSIARNLNGSVKNFTTANFDMIHHYRPNVNIVKRPVLAGGAGYYIVGHHEIMLPLLVTSILSEL